VNASLPSVVPAAAEQAAALSVTDLTKRFTAVGTGAVVTVIDRLNLTVDQNEFICILGSSGCGKSTFLNILAGLDPQYEGRIAVHGVVATGGKLPIRIGYLFQEPRLLPWLTAERNVDFALSSCRVPPEHWKPRKDEYFAMTGLDRFRGHYPHQMSGGMCQRLALVRALCVEPDLLLMDEPFSGLDELTARRLRVDLLNIWNARKKTIVFVTHNSYEACYLSDRILVMARGVVREEIRIDVPRPRDYDDPRIFELNRSVVRKFLEIAGDA
jgi:NitT/TauT family transport system ATP-binding protein